MDKPANPATTITVFTRHSPECKKKAGRYWRRCNCRKALYIHEGGRGLIKSARTRSWEQAERLAQVERDLSDPIEIERRKIKEQEAEKIAAKKAKNITVTEACDRWIAAQKFQSNETAAIYRRAARRIQPWAQDQGIEDLRDVTP